MLASEAMISQSQTKSEFNYVLGHPVSSRKSSSMQKSSESFMTGPVFRTQIKFHVITLI